MEDAAQSRRAISQGRAAETASGPLLRNARMNAFAAETEAIGRAGGDPRMLSMGQDAYDTAQKGNCKCCE